MAELSRRRRVARARLVARIFDACGDCAAANALGAGRRCARHTLRHLDIMDAERPSRELREFWYARAKESEPVKEQNNCSYCLGRCAHDVTDAPLPEIPAITPLITTNSLNEFSAHLRSVEEQETAIRETAWQSIAYSEPILSPNSPLRPITLPERGTLVSKRLVPYGLAPSEAMMQDAPIRSSYWTRFRTATGLKPGPITYKDAETGQTLRIVGIRGAVKHKESIAARFPGLYALMTGNAMSNLWRGPKGRDGRQA